MMKRKGVASWKVISNRKSNKMPVISIMKAIQLIDSLFVWFSIDFCENLLAEWSKDLNKKHI